VTSAPPRSRLRSTDISSASGAWGAARENETGALHDEEGRTRIGDAAQHTRRDRHAQPVGEQKDAEDGRKEIGVVLAELAEQPDPKDLQSDNHIARQENQDTPHRQAAMGRLRRRHGRGCSGAGARRGGRPQAGNEAERQQRRQHVETGGEPQRAHEPDIADENPAAEQRPQASSQRVEPVEQADALGDRVDGVRYGARQQRQRGPHQRRRQHEAGEAQREDRGRCVDLAGQPGCDPVVEKRLGNQGEKPDPDLGRGETEQRAHGAQPVRDTCAGQRTDAEPREEGPDDQRGGNRVRAGEDPQHPLPDDLAQQRREAGGKKGEREARHHAPVLARHAPPLPVTPRRPSPSARHRR
jgi:hypothetical protein